jgi:hypothetical protein
LTGGLSNIKNGLASQGVQIIQLGRVTKKDFMGVFPIKGCRWTVIVDMVQAFNLSGTVRSYQTNYILNPKRREYIFCFYPTKRTSNIESMLVSGYET